MKLKVCGMRDEQNIRELLKLSPDFMGMIFYSKSPRFVAEQVSSIKGQKSTQKVGVFVNPTKEEVLEKVEEYALDYVQLHGGESVALVKALNQSGISVIKVFSVMDELPIEKMKPYEAFADYFLFDTKTPKFGGSGRKFDWSILENYSLKKPFFLSGGIDAEDVEDIRKLDLPMLEVIDINSRFELKPGLKDIEKIKRFKEIL